MKNKQPIDPEYIRQVVQKAFGFSLEGFSFEQIIDCCDPLTKKEKKWAKKNLDWKIIVIGEE